MNTSYRILAATDFSKDAANAVERAAMLAAEHGTQLRLLHVVSEPSVIQLRAGLRSGTDVERLLVTDARRSMEKLAGEVQARHSVTIIQQIEVGSIVDTVLLAMRHSDLLVVGPRGLHPAQSLFIGSMAERLLRRAVCPMLVVRSAPRTRYARVLIPVDFSSHSLAAIAFAQLLTPGAARQVMHSFECPFEGQLRMAGVQQSIIEEYRQEAAVDARKSMEELLASAPQKAMRSTIDYGDPREVIIATAERQAADLIVIGKRGRALLEEHFLGGTTRAVLAGASCDVAVVPETSSLRRKSSTN